MASQPIPQPGAVTEVEFGQGDDGNWTPDSRVPPEATGQATNDEDFARQAAAMGGYQKRPNRVWPVLAALVAVGGFAGVAWLAYNWGLETGFSHEVPVVRAEPGPVKTKPEDPGGLQVPNQDKQVLNQGADGNGEPRVERLLSAPETPQPPAKPEAMLAPSEPATAPEPAETPQIATAPEPAPVAAPPVVTEAAPSTLEASTTPQVGKPAATAPESTATPKVGGTGGGGGTGNGTESGAGAKAMAAAGAVQVAAVQKGDFVIQLASVTSSDAADKEWARLQKTFPDLLGDMNLAVQEANVNGQLYHRVQTGPFPSRATAQDMCAQIKGKNQACIVQQR